MLLFSLISRNIPESIAYDELPTLFQPFSDQCSHHIETSQLICSTNQLAGFYMMGTLIVKGLISRNLSFCLDKLLFYCNMIFIITVIIIIIIIIIIIYYSMLRSIQMIM